jgi:hypothetical protein
MKIGIHCVCFMFSILKFVGYKDLLDKKRVRNYAVYI